MEKEEKITQAAEVTHLEMPGLQGITTSRTYKDSLFRVIYSGKDERSRRWLLSLYNALSGKNYTNTGDLRITTIETVIYLTMKNDLSFLLDSQMNLFEHQSTVNPNMPLRGLMYFGQLYQNEVNRQKKDIFGSTLIKIPSPRFIVFYNGEKEFPDTFKYRLSEAFDVPDKSGEFEWTATVININKNHSETLQKKCESLYHYIEFVERVKTNQRNGMEASAAINEAVDYAIQHDFLEGFFKEQKMYILTNLLTEFDQELHDRCTREAGYEEGVADGMAEGMSKGIAEGAQQTAIANAKKLIFLGVPPETVAEGCALPLEQVLALKEEVESIQNA